jgi:Flagellar basal body-associated protein
MATFKNTTMPARSTLPMRTGGSGRFLKPLVALLALIIVAGASVAATWLIATRTQQGQVAGPASPASAVSQGAMPVTYTAPPSTPPAVPSPIFVALEPFTVTVQDPDSERVLHVGITLRVADQQSRDRIEKFMPEVRSRIVMLLSSLRPSDLQGSQGKVDLARAITASVNKPFSPLPDGQYVTDVLFTAFVVQ